MKKNPIIFIAMLVALAFTSCQMNTDDSVVIPPTPTYTITVTETNGTVTLSKTEAKAGEKVFVESISPNEGYTTNGLEQTFQSKDGKTLTLDFGTEDGKRYFVMPECNVVITVTFKAATSTPTTEATYTITVTGDQTNGSAKVTNASDKEITSAKAGENVTLTVKPNSGYKFDATITINGQSETKTDSAERSYTMVMPTSNITVNVSFTQISNNNGGEDNNGGEPPATANEYTVSVASGIKGGHIEVSLDNATWTTLSTSTKYAKNTKLYVRAVADKHYEYKDGLRTDGFDGQLNYIMLNSNAELNANFVIKKESLLTASCIITPTNTVTNDYKNSKFRIEVQIANAKFEAGWNKAKIALGFDECYYEELRENLNSSPKYYYEYPTEITSFKESLDNTKKIAYVGINGENFEIPDVGKLYLVLENTSGQKAMYEMYQSDVNKFKVKVE